MSEITQEMTTESQEATPAAPKKGSGFAITSMVLGIVSTVLFFLIVIPIPAAVVGIVLGWISLQQKRAGKGQAIAGVILSGVALVLVIWVIAAALIYSSNTSTTLKKYTMGSETIPSISSLMDEKDISYDYLGREETVGKMVVPSIVNYFKTPEKATVEITEETYENVSDVFGAINAVGKLLSEEYDYTVTYPPTEYPNYGEDYRFCELIKQSEDNENDSYYVSAIYNNYEGVIKMRYGVIGAKIGNNGIGPLNLEKIAQEK